MIDRNAKRGTDLVLACVELADPAGVIIDRHASRVVVAVSISWPVTMLRVILGERQDRDLDRGQRRLKPKNHASLAFIVGSLVHTPPSKWPRECGSRRSKALCSRDKIAHSLCGSKYDRSSVVSGLMRFPSSPSGFFECTIEDRNRFGLRYPAARRMLARSSSERSGKNRYRKSHRYDPNSVRVRSPFGTS